MMTKSNLIFLIINTMMIIIERGAKPKPSLVVAFQVGPCYYTSVPLLHAHWTLPMPEIIIFIMMTTMTMTMMMMTIILGRHYFPLSEYLAFQNVPLHDDIFTGLPTHCPQLRLPPSVRTLLFNFKMDTTPCEGGYYLPTQKVGGYKISKPNLQKRQFSSLRCFKTNY